MTTMHDHLLEWCSERLSGTIVGFREAHDWLARRQGIDSDSRLVLYTMQTLGHLEVDWLGRRWAATPPVVTALEDSGGNALLVGARPRWLMRRLQTLAFDPDESVQELAEEIDMYEPMEQEGAPAAQFLTGHRDESLAALCVKLDLRFEHRVSLRLRDALPTLDSYLAAGEGASPPPGMEARRFVAEPRPGWVEVDDDHGAGAYEYEAYGAPRYQYCEGGSRFEVEKAIAVYAELRRISFQALFYSVDKSAMYVPGRMPLPLLAARCAVLRTGLLPHFFPRGLKKLPHLGVLNQYFNIPQIHCKSICDSLGQQFSLY